MNHERTLKNGSLEKAYLLYTDYAMSSDPTDKEALLELLSSYIYEINDHKAILMYSKICDSSDSERETYSEILCDILTTMRSETIGGIV